MKFGVVNKSTILNRFVLHTLQRNITYLAVITRKTNIKLGILKGGETGKEPCCALRIHYNPFFAQFVFDLASELLYFMLFIDVGLCEKKKNCFIISNQVLFVTFFLHFFFLKLFHDAHFKVN